MRLTKRRQTYIWASWLGGHLAGEKHCEWSLWLRANYEIEKVPEDPEKANKLSQWKAEHGELVTQRTDELTMNGWTVRVEDQNKFNYRGKAATVGGCPDLVALKPGLLRVDDLKGGKRRDEHFWQVALYGFLLPLVNKAYAELVVEGGVVYRDGVRELSAADIVAARPVIVERIRRVAAPAEPPRTPSPSECAWCDIAGCPERASGDVMSAEGDAF